MNDFLWQSVNNVIKQRWRAFSVALLLTLLLPSTYAESFDSEHPKPKEELAVILPPAPQPENLLPLDARHNASQSFAVDAQSLSISEDGIIFYTVVATSRSGARNISHEGLRCSSFEYRQYAFGRRDGTWARSRRKLWKPISSRAHNQLHATLAKDYFCDIRSTAGTAEEIIDRIRHQRTIEDW